MLLNKDKRQVSGQVSIVTRSPEATRLLSAFFAIWKIPTVEDLTSAQVVLVELGLSHGAPEENVIWLTPLPIENRPYLELPLQLPLLSRCIEERFFTTARRQLRVAMDLPVQIVTEGLRQEARLISLSGRGARLSCPGEFAKGQKLELDVVLGGRSLRLPAEVLYTLPAGDLSDHKDPQAGVLFKPIDLQIFEGISRFVECVCLEEACSRAGFPVTAACVSWVNVPRNPWSVMPD